MKKADVTKIMLFLSATYGKKFDYPSGDDAKDSLKENVWHQQLRHTKPIDAQKAVETYINAGHEWPPHPGQIAAQVRKLTQPETTPGIRAWQMTVDAIRKYGAFYGAEQIKETLPEEVWNTVLMFGLENIANSDTTDTYLMNRFVKTHDEQNLIQQERALLNPVRRNLLEEGDQ